MARRNTHDPLQPTSAASWIVVRDALSDLVESREIGPGVDLRAILTAEREARIAAGWKADRIGKDCSFFFCKKDDVRVIVSIAMRDPSRHPSGY